MLRWFERKLFTGEVLSDYGDLHDARSGISRLRTSILLCRRKNRLKLMVRTLGTAPFGASANYAEIDLNPSVVRRLREIVNDLEALFPNESNAEHLLSPDKQGTK